jgi:hypothetical protein
MTFWVLMTSGGIIDLCRTRFRLFLFTTKCPTRQSRNPNSDYLPQRRKGRKGRKITVKKFLQNNSSLPSELGVLCALAGGISESESLRLPENLRKPHKLFNDSSTDHEVYPKKFVGCARRTVSLDGAQSAPYAIQQLRKGRKLSTIVKRGSYMSHARGCRSLTSPKDLN